MTYQRILVGIDFSKASARALREAVRLASYDSIPVHVLHVVDHRVLENLESQVVVDQDLTLSEAKRRLADFAAIHTPHYDDLQLEVILGHPFNDLIKAINDHQVDLVVMGSHGTSDDPHRLGAIASKCLRKAPAPVLIVDDRKEESFGKVVCAVDYSDTSKMAIEQAIQVANLEQADLEFIHVYVPPASFQNPESGVMLIGFEGVVDYPNVARSNLEKHIEPYKESINSKNVTYTAVDHMSVGRGIIHHLKENGGDLLVLGTHGRTGWRSLLLGTTAEHIFHKIPCSTLAVKPADFTYTVN